ncbi:L-serine dehydratase, beta subunit [Streptococcus sp. ZB199]|nr:L-serine dehydratase, beta subunit [Streptococcus sp. ZB199]
MNSLKFQSVFDIIGPVMIGPSSSHTAGAVRIGKIVSSIFGEEPKEVEFQLFNSFAKTYRGHGTDLALVAGILGMDTDDPRIPDSLKIAHERGIRIVWSIQKRAMLLTQTQQPLLLKMIIKRFLSLESQLVVGTYRLLS